MFTPICFGATGIGKIDGTGNACSTLFVPQFNPGSRAIF